MRLEGETKGSLNAGLMLFQDFMLTTAGPLVAKAHTLVCLADSLLK